jgi:HEAT repeat protein
MRKINHLWFTIWFAIGVSLLVSGCPSKSGVEGKAWFRYASEYDQARSIMIADMATEPNRFRQDYTAVEKLKQTFLRAKQPTETEIVSVLRSPDKRFQRVGLAAMSIKPLETDMVTDILFEFLQDQDRIFRLYAVFSLKEFKEYPESRKVILGKQLLEAIKKENDADVLFQGIPLLGRFPDEKAVPYLTEQLAKEGKDNRASRYSAFVALKKMGNSYYDKAAEYVNEHGSPEIKKELLDLENYWKTKKE